MNSVTRLSTILTSLIFIVAPVFGQTAGSTTAFARGCEQMMHKNFANAISSFTEAISDDAGDVNSYFRRGQSFFCVGNYKEAIVDFDRALAKGAMDYNVYLWKGTAYAKLDNMELSVFNYEKAMRLNPRLVATYKSSALPKSMESPKSLEPTKTLETPKTIEPTKPLETPKTIEPTKPLETPKTIEPTKTLETPNTVEPTKTFETTNTVEPTKTLEITKNTELTKTLETAKNTEPPKAAETQPAKDAEVSNLESRIEAVRAAAANISASKFGAKAVDHETSPIGRKAATLSLGNSQRPLEAYETAARKIAENEVGYFRAGTTYSGLLNSAGAVIPLSGFSGQPVWVETAQKGRPYLSLKDPRRDLRELDSRIILHPQDASLYFQRARVNQHLGKTTETLNDLNRAIELDGANAHYFLARAFYYHHKNDDNLAEADIRRAQDVDPIVPTDLTFDTPADKERSTKS